MLARGGWSAGLTSATRFLYVFGEISSTFFPRPSRFLVCFFLSSKSPSSTAHGQHRTTAAVPITAEDPMPYPLLRVSAHMAVRPISPPRSLCVTRRLCSCVNTLSPLYCKVWQRKKKRAEKCDSSFTRQQLTHTRARLSLAHSLTSPRRQYTGTIIMHMMAMLT